MTNCCEQDDPSSLYNNYDAAGPSSYLMDYGGQVLRQVLRTGPSSLYNNYDAAGPSSLRFYAVSNINSNFISIKGTHHVYIHN
ncbi:MAG: hypothetical protein WCZ89_06925 [Phycisphaerae bacterium]